MVSVHAHPTFELSNTVQLLAKPAPNETWGCVQKSPGNPLPYLTTVPIGQTQGSCHFCAAVSGLERSRQIVFPHCDYTHYVLLKNIHLKCLEPFQSHANTCCYKLIASFPGSSPAFCRILYIKQYEAKSWGGAWERGYNKLTSFNI